MYFYEPGTTTPKNTYSNNGLTTANSNPVVLSASGVLPNVFLDGSYKVVLKDKDGVQQWERDSVNSVSELAFAAYDGTITYGLGGTNIVYASNAKYYISLEANNLGNEPSASPTKWQLLIDYLLKSQSVVTTGQTVIGNATTGLSSINTITKGTLAVGNGTTTTTLAVGANTKILTANSAVAAGVEWADPATIVVNIQEFDASGTWAKPAGATACLVESVGAGGGGGGGARQVSGSDRSGGGAGGGGAFAWSLYDTDDLAATVAVTIGAGGGGGAGGALDGNAGSNGSAGGNTTFGAHLTAFGGGAGTGGALGSPSSGGSGGGPLSAASVASTSAITGLLSGYGAIGSNVTGTDGGGAKQGGAGGGSGGGIAVDDVAKDGGDGGSDAAATGGGGAGGTAASNGTAGAAFEGGGGGASNAAGVGGTGGAGGYGGGGGGGAAAQGGPGGAGGAGGGGYLRVTTW